MYVYTYIRTCTLISLVKIQTMCSVQHYNSKDQITCMYHIPALSNMYIHTYVQYTHKYRPIYVNTSLNE